MNGEIWKPVPGIAYEASSLGRIRRRGSAKVLGQHAGGGRPGFTYLRVHCPSFGQRGKLVFVHVLVALAFHGQPPGPRGNRRGEYGVNHINGSKTDNRPENLEWVTTSQNHRHAFATGVRTAQRGAARYNAKLSDESVREIRDRYARGGVTQRALAHEFGVCLSVLREVLQRKRWRHVA